MPTPENYLKGRGSQINVNNKFLENKFVQEHSEGIDDYDLGNPQTEFFEEHPKKIVNEIKSPDVGMLFSVNPYQGCEHGCIYCYARNSHEYWGFSAGLDFERKIIVKKNAPDLLKKNFDNKNWKVSPITLSGNTDCYQPIERKLKITRQLLEICLQYGNPVGMITKNALVLRDLDIISQLAKKRLFHIMITITSLDESLRRKMEPRTATYETRLKVVEELSKANVPVGVMTAPIIPGLNSHEIPNIIEEASKRGAKSFGYTIVRLNGAIGEIFKDWLHKNFPDRAEKVWHQIGECHGGNVHDSRWGTRMRGEGKIAEAIRRLHRISVHKFVKEKSDFEYNLDEFSNKFSKQTTLF